jgi:RND family efflux transporter MFP subunit
MKAWLANRRRRWAVGLLAGAVALGAFGIAQRLGELSGAPRYGERPLAVTTDAAERGALTVTRDFLAVVEARRSAAVTARFTAAVAEVAVDEGERVARGDVLVRLDDAELRAERRSLEAEIRSVRAERAAERANRDALAESVAYWERELERQQALADKDMTSASKLDQTADRLTEVRGRLAASKGKVASLGEQLESLAARHDQLSERLADYTLRAPFDGVVAERHVDPGDQAAPGKAVVRVDAPGRRLAFDLPQGDLADIRPGQTVRYRHGGETHTVGLDRVHPRLNAARLARAEAELPAEAAEGLAAGAHQPVSVVLRRLQGATLVPARAVTASPQGAPHVFTLVDGRLRAREITELGRSGDRVAVRGVEPGAQVVVSTYLGWSRLADGREARAKR